MKKGSLLDYLIRLIKDIIRLPQYIQYLTEGLDREEILKIELTQQQQEINKIKQQLEDQEKKYIYQNNKFLEDYIPIFRKYNEDRKQEIWNLQKYIEELRKSNQDRYNEIVELTETINRLKKLDVPNSYIKKMNILLSSHYTLWGKEEKLHISKLAAVGSCFFNTNSGRISIGDYTFAGSGVSVLAGSHDTRLTGLLRRDVEMKEGYDIEIGNGVWLASNCTILGPAKIGDNAVIASGAVVVPGTIVPQDAIMGGIPAKCIGKVNDEKKIGGYNSAIMDALQRNNGVIYVDGWTEKYDVTYDGSAYCGHALVKNEGIIYTLKNNLKFFYQLDIESKKQKLKMNYIVDGQKKEVMLNSYGGYAEFEIENLAINIHIIKIFEISDVKTIFVSDIL